MSQLKDKTAIVTGGARGIGRAIVEQFADEGAAIAVFDVAFPDDFEGFANGIREKGGKLEAYTVDITSSEAVEEACSTVAADFGSIDILVNNAGITRDKLLLRMGDDDWDKVMEVNLKGSFLMTRTVAKTMMRQRKGKIVNISSVVGVMGNAGQSNYSASKAGLIGFTKSTAKELASRNINVNAIAPGYVETEMTHVLSEEQLKAFLNIIPLKRGCSPKEIADTVTFLASEKSDYITGQVINVDGGMIM
ncbi:MAG: 3-oxoacyl-[acyl-carrier-protein] reductase [Ignavibacteria bacterium]|nr:MAG: 3-oxoacyl-[acyl-carrier-protein] reductase [Ignavibacteria bacterium]